MADADDNCAACAAEIPRPPVFVDPFCVKRWEELVGPSTGDPIPVILRVVTESQEVEGTRRFLTSRY